MNELATVQISEPGVGLAACISQMITDLHAAFNVPMLSPDDHENKIRAYSFALSDVPLADFPPLTALLIRDLPTGFMPSAGQVFSFWQRMSGQAPANVANAGAYQPYQPKPTDRFLGANSGSLGAEAARLNLQRFSAGLLAVTCDCVTLTASDGYRYFKTAILSPDAAQWICAENNCSFQASATETMDTPSKGTPGPLMDSATIEVPAPRESDNELLEALDKNADIAVEKIPQRAALSFARHLRLICHSCEWTPKLAREEWPLWMEQGGAKFFEKVAA